MAKLETIKNSEKYWVVSVLSVGERNYLGYDFHGRLEFSDKIHNAIKFKSLEEAEQRISNPSRFEDIVWDPDKDLDTIRVEEIEEQKVERIIISVPSKKKRTLKKKREQLERVNELKRA